MKDAHGNSNGIPREKLPVLIVAYCRAPQLRKLLEMLVGDDRKVYVSIDKAPSELSSQNEQVRFCAESFRDKLSIVIHINETPAGVKFGVPRAVDWVMGLEQECIVIEDDCVPTLTALEYFDAMRSHLVCDVALVSGDSPWDEGESKYSSLSSYPLIWGWSTNRSQWEKISSDIGGRIPWMAIVAILIRKPKSFVPVSYFLAAQIRVKQGLLQAWDCSIALTMLVKELKCVTPNIRIIDNYGDDQFAHHTRSKAEINRRSVVADQIASQVLLKDSNSKKYTDAAIQDRVYRMRVKHLFSPIKALLHL